ncbi:MAG: hypothetical protein GY835_04105 [bacterium]|nr:hypothetical protein [bacterium]
MQILKWILLITILICGALPASAIHTLEPYGPGASYLEIQAQRRSHGAESDSLRGWSVELKPGWGISSSLSTYLEVGLISTDRYDGGLDFVTLGILRNIFDRSMRGDLIAEIQARGEGLRRNIRSVGYELNSDSEQWGLYMRDLWSWQGDGEDLAGDVIVGRSRLLTEGIWMQMSPTVQLLVEATQENLSGFDTMNNGTRDTAWSIGYNRNLTENVVLLMEARRSSGPADEKVWDYGFGLMMNW